MTFWRREWKAALLLTGGFLLVHAFPLEALHSAVALPRPAFEALALARWYAREHVVLCLVPAFFIAGAISVFVRGESVMRYLGARANKVLAYGVASVSGTILAVCSCTVLPLFAGLYTRGAGLGPATTFLYSGPAINVLAIILTARVLGLELGMARAVGAVTFSIVIGLLMHVLFRREERAREATHVDLPESGRQRPLWQTGLLFGSLVAILVFANWGAPAGTGGFFAAIHSVKWLLTAGSAVLLGGVLVAWFGLPVTRVVIPGAVAAGAAVAFPAVPAVPFAAGTIGLSAAASTAEGEPEEWFAASWAFAKQILPLLLLGVLVAGALLGRPGEEGLIPTRWVAAAVGGNSLAANLMASVAGALMYFATLTEVPVVQALLGSGMGKGPALALLLAGPALSLPSMLVMRSIMGTRKTVAFIVLVVVMATVTGLVYGVVG